MFVTVRFLPAGSGQGRAQRVGVGATHALPSPRAPRAFCGRCSILAPHVAWSLLAHRGAPPSSWVMVCRRRSPASGALSPFVARLKSVTASRPPWGPKVAAARLTRGPNAARPPDRGVAATTPPNLGTVAATVALGSAGVTRSQATASIACVVARASGWGRGVSKTDL